MSDVQRRPEAEPSPAAEAASSLEAGARRLQQDLGAEVPRSAAEPALSPAGKAVLEDVQQVAAAAREIVTEKLQPASAEAERKVHELTGEPPSSPAPHGEAALRTELQALLQQLRECRGDLLHVAKLVVYSSSFRRLFLEALAIAQEALRDTRFELGGEAPADTGLAELQARLQGQALQEAPAGPPPAAADRLAGRFVGLLRDTRSAPEFVEAFDRLAAALGRLEALDTLAIAVKPQDELSSSERQVYEAAKASDAVRAGIRVKVFVEHWIAASTDPLLRGLADIRRSLLRDAETLAALRALAAWFQQALRADAYDEQRSRAEFQQHVALLRTRLAKYRGPLEHLAQEAAVLAERVQRDELTLKLAGSLQDLAADLFRDPQGNLTVKPELWGDLKAVLPVLLQRLRFLQLPEVVVRDESLDLTTGPTTLSVGELAPKRLQAHLYADLESTQLNPAEADLGAEYDLRSVFVVEAGRIFAEARNVALFLDRKAFPPLTDAGMADLNIHGDDGMRLRLVFGAAHAKGEAAAPFRLLKAACTIDQLDLRPHETRHSWMYSVLGPLIRRGLRKRIEAEVEKYLLSGDWLSALSSPEALL